MENFFSSLLEYEPYIELSSFWYSNLFFQKIKKKLEFKTDFSGADVWRELNERFYFNLPRPSPQWLFENRLSQWW